MKRLIILLFIGSTASISAQNATQSQWTKSYNDPDSWDRETLEMESTYAEILISQDFPITMSPFPVPNYDSPGNGNNSKTFQIADKKVQMQTALIYKGTGTEDIFKNSEFDSRHYFTIIALADEEDMDDPLVASSRNHPNYFSQGSLNTNSTSRLDWVAVQLENGQAYAIVNGRLFLLNEGAIILAAPQKDHTMRFLQLDYIDVAADDFDSLLEKIKTSETANAFFKNDNNI